MALCNILACGGMPGYQHGEEMLYAEVNGRARELTVFTIMRGCRAPRTSSYFLSVLLRVFYAYLCSFRCLWTGGLVLRSFSSITGVEKYGLPTT